MPPRLYRFDRSWRKKGFPLLAGVDEAGIGPWAGPVVAAAVVLKPDAVLKDLDDSKKLSPQTRETLFDLIQREALAWAVSAVDPCVVDEINILQASFLAARRCLAELSAKPDLVLFDGCRKIPHCPFPLETVVKGDAQSACIAAASVLAKVTRDRLMREAHEKYPAYGFDQHKGYGTPLHWEALRRHGPCAIHRRSYAPVMEVLSPDLPLSDS